MHIQTINNTDKIILIHGAWHGAWSFERIIPILEELGHEVEAFDLPGHGQKTENMADQTLETYTTFVCDILQRQKAPVILAGHSMAGMIITEAAQRYPEKISKLVYMNAFLPAQGQSAQANDGSGITPKDFSKVSTDGLTQTWTEKTVREIFAQACTDKDQEYILQHLNKTQAIEPLCAKVYPTEDKWGSVRRYFIAGAKDKAMTMEKVHTMLERVACEEVFAVQGDHEIFFSAPQELAFTLHLISLR